MLVAQLLSVKGSEVVSVFGSIRLRQAAQIMIEREVGALVVLTHTGQLDGVISERRIVEAIALRAEAALELRVSYLVWPAPPTVAPSDTVSEALAIMTRRRHRHLPVVSNGRVVGLVSLGDVAKARLSEKDVDR